MNGTVALLVMGAIILALFIYLIRGIARRSGDHAALEEREADQRRHVESLKQQETVKDERLSRMADAATASVSEPASAAVERMRKRPASTK